MRHKRIVILVPELRVRTWVRTLADELQARLPLTVELRRVAVPAPPPLPLERFERRMTGRPQLCHAEWMPTGSIPMIETAECEDDLVISAVEQSAETLGSYLGPVTLLMPLFDGDFRLAGVFSAFLESEPPRLQVMFIAGSERRCLNSATVAVPMHELLPRGLTTILARVIVLLRGAVELCLKRAPGREEAASAPALPRRVGAPWLSRAIGTYLPKIGRRLSNRLRVRDWCVAYRPCGTGGSPPDISIGHPSFTAIHSGDGQFYADPILFRHEDTTAIFFEDFDWQTNRAKISCVVLNADGTCGQPVEVLARPYHLSYPFILATGGAVLMVPETSANRTIEFYEAVRFPYVWELRSVLPWDIDASDTTLHFDAEQRLWWMFTSVCEHDTAAWDTLSLFYAETIDGPWHAHSANPVKLDARSSRPAGPLIQEGARLLRPAQDCSRGYGGAISWCEIQELSPDRFRETVIGHTRPQGRYYGLHTYSRAGGFEVVDFSRIRWRGFRRGRPVTPVPTPATDRTEGAVARGIRQGAAAKAQTPDDA